MNIIKSYKQIKKVSTIFFILIFILSNQIYAKYNYQITLDAFSLNRDTSEIIYQIEKSIDDGEYTNKDIALKIISNKEIEEVEGFSLDESRKVLTKTVTENEEKNVILKDLSGNTKEVQYIVNNIDKEPPEILGIDDGVTYNQKMSVDYADNVGIKDIKVDKYGDRLEIFCQQDFYDSSFYKGLDVLGTQVYLDVIQHPKGTKYYKFYLNNVLKATTETSEYTYKGLSKGTTYTVMVQAINEENQVIESVSHTVKTKCFSGITAEKVGNNFHVKISGIDSSVNVGFCCLWNQNSDTNRKWTYPTINSDRSIDLSFNAYDIDGTKCYGYYYLHLQFSSSEQKFNDVLCMNIVFDTTYVKQDDMNLDPNNLNKSGKYEIKATDLAGNETIKNCIIKL